MADTPKVRVKAERDVKGRKFKVTCDRCPDDEPVRFHAHHWAVAHANHHAKHCPYAPEPVPDAPHT